MNAIELFHGYPCQSNHQCYQTVLSSPETVFNPNPSSIYIDSYHWLCSDDEEHYETYCECLKNVTIDNNSINLINGVCFFKILGNKR